MTSQDIDQSTESIETAEVKDTFESCLHLYLCLSTNLFKINLSFRLYICSESQQCVVELSLS